MRREARTDARNVVIQIDCILHGHGPEVRISNFRPVDGGMEEHCSGDAGDRTNGAFGDSVLMMSSGAGEVVNLLEISEAAREVVGRESRSLVGNVGLRTDPVVKSSQLKAVFGA